MLDFKFTEAQKRQRREKFRGGGGDVPLQDLAKVMRDLAKVVTQVNVFPAEFPAVKTGPSRGHHAHAKRK